jgi:hypothetical protein
LSKGCGGGARNTCAPRTTVADMLGAAVSECGTRG